MPKLSSALLLLALLSPSLVRAEVPTRSVVIVDAVRLAPKVANAHERMLATLAAALAAKRWTMARVLAGEECHPTCVAALLESTGARYVLRLAGDRNQDDGYDLVIELWQPGTARPRLTNAYCDYCNVERMAEVAGRTAGDMLAAAEDESTSRGRGEAVAASSPTARPLPAAPPLPAPVRAGPAENRGGPSAWVPWVLMGAGAVTLAYGGWALYRDGQTTGDCSLSPTTTCTRYASKTVGVAALVSGGALALGGLVWEIARLAPGTSLSASPNHVAIHMRF